MSSNFAICNPSSYAVADHFPDVGKMINLGKDITSHPFTADVKRSSTEQVLRLLFVLEGKEAGIKVLMEQLLLKHRPSFIESYLNPALQAALIEMTQPNSPRSPTQKYRLTDAGRRLVQQINNEAQP